MVLATGGGIVSERITFELLLGLFFTIWIRASPEHTHMANEDAAMDELRTILSSRGPLYARARVTIDTSGRRVDDALTDILSVIAPAHATA